MNQDISSRFHDWLNSHESAPQDWKEFQSELRIYWETLEMQNHQLREKNVQDELTGLLKYPAFCDQLKRHLLVQSQMAVIMLDIDDFKHINRSYGHLSGNKVLEMLSRILKQELPMSGLLGRFGGDEFLIAFPCHSPLMLKAYCILLLQKIRQSRFSLAGNGISIEVSIGATLSTYADNQKSLILRSDKALNTAKLSGKNRYHYQELDHVHTIQAQIPE